MLGLAKAVGWVVLCALGLLSQATCAAPCADQPKDSNLPFYKLEESNGLPFSRFGRYLLLPYNQIPSAERVERLISEGAFKPWRGTLNLGYTHADLWLAVRVSNATAIPQTFLWSVYNYIDSVALYRYYPSGISAPKLIAYSHEAGNTPAAKRVYHTRYVSLPFVLKAGEEATLLLHVQRKGANFYLPTDITTLSDFALWEKDYLIESNWYWIFGFCFTAFLLNLGFFLVIKERVHLWYAAYVAAIGIFLLMEDGLDALLFPGWLYTFCLKVEQYNFLILASGLGMGVLSAYLSKAQNRTFGTWYNVIMATAILFPFIDMLFINLPGKEDLSVFISQEIQFVLLALVILTMLSTAIKATLQKNRAAFSYLPALVFFTVGAILFCLNRLSITNFNLLKPNVIAAGLVAELAWLLALMLTRFAGSLRETAELRLSALERERLTSIRMAAVQDQERTRLARDLHDDLGGTLVRLNLALDTALTLRKLDSEPLLDLTSPTIAGQQTTIDASAHQFQLLEKALSEASSLARQAITDARAIAHELMPPALAGNSLIDALEELCTSIARNAKVSFSFQYAGTYSPLPAPIMLGIYRIAAELCSNIVRHSHATQAQLLLVFESEEIRITVEDNGIGFETEAVLSGQLQNKQSLGMGLQNVRDRVTLLSGKLVIDSTLTKGTMILIELPI
jgi:signal transduction histidine kinase